MGNLEYWKTSLANVLEKEEITDKLVEKIIGIYEMEYEYTEFESHKSAEQTNPLEKIVDKLRSEIRVLERYISNSKNVDSVQVENGQVKFYSKLP